MAAIMMSSRQPRSARFAILNIRRWKTTLPGRLGDPNMLLSTEPRMNQTLLEIQKKELVLGYGPAGAAPPCPFGPSSPLFLQHMWVNVLEKYVLPEMLCKFQKMPADVSRVDQFTEVIKGTDGNDITLHIAKPKDTSERVPGILHTHGGGMTFMSTADIAYEAYRANLVNRGFAVVSVEFRNAGGRLGRHPFPAGLNDCMSGLGWAHANREKLGISKLILSGESGGGNLSLAIAIRAKREGRLAEFDGVFAMCPFIAGPVMWREQSLPSMKECDKYFIDMNLMMMCAKLYDPDLKNVDNPCAWPLVAKASDLEGLPPHFISVNELDPLRDEGLAYCEKLKAAGVKAESRIAKGTPHGQDMSCQSYDACNDIFKELLDAQMDFVDSL